MQPTEVLIPLAFFAVIFGIIYVRSMTLHRQRMAMIEKGLDPSSIGDRPDQNKTLRTGMFFMGVGIGLALGWVVDYAINMDQWGNNPMPYFIAVLICGGAALLQYHRMVSRKQQG